MKRSRLGAKEVYAMEGSFKVPRGERGKNERSVEGRSHGRVEQEMRCSCTIKLLFAQRLLSTVSQLSTPSMRQISLGFERDIPGTPE